MILHEKEIHSMAELKEFLSTFTHSELDSPFPFNESYRVVSFDNTHNDGSKYMDFTIKEVKN